MHVALILRSGLGCLLALASLFVLAGAQPIGQRNMTRPAVGPRADFRGWEAVALRSRSAEVIVVPSIGRILQFSLLDEDGHALPGPFWNNPAGGPQLARDAEGWANYGGDKVWPAPQSEWPRITGRGWPPPLGFDAVAFTASIHDNAIELVSPVDQAYGIRVRRVITLDSQKPVMKIETTYEKVQGPAVRVGVWSVTQLNSPERAFVLLPKRSNLAKGYTDLGSAPPKDLTIDGRLLSVVRDPDHNTMIGSDGEVLLWVGDGPDLLIENKSSAPIDDTAEWPERGSHSKIYTNAGEQIKYVELELLNPLRELRPGQKAVMKSSYTLIPRTETDPLHEAKKVFAQPQTSGIIPKR